MQLNLPQALRHSEVRNSQPRRINRRFWDCTCSSNSNSDSDSDSDSNSDSDSDSDSEGDSEGDSESGLGHGRQAERTSDASGGATFKEEVAARREDVSVHPIEGSILEEGLAPQVGGLDWVHKDDVQREMRPILMRLLRAASYGKDKVEAVAEHVVDLLKRRSGA